MPIISRGQFGKETVESNSFAVNLLKYPEILSDYVSQDGKWLSHNLLEGLGRVENQDIQGRKVEWYLQTRTQKNSTATGTVVGTGVGNTPVEVEFYENWINPNDVVVFEDGSQAVVIGSPVQTATGWNYTMRFKFDNGSTTATFDGATYAADGKQVGVLTSNFPEGSDRGWGNNAFPDKYINYTSIRRTMVELTGNALTEVTWLEQGGQKQWLHTALKQKMDNFLNKDEAERWYGKRSIAVDTTTFAETAFLLDSDGKPIYSMDGIHEQISSSNIDTYSGALTTGTLDSYLEKLLLSDGSQANDEYVVAAGAAGKLAIHNALKDFIDDSSGMMYSLDANGYVKVGYNANRYVCPFGTLTVFHNKIYDDVTYGFNALAADGRRQESYRLTFLNFGLTDGISNIRIAANSNHGINRGMIIKYIGGMVNPWDGSKQAANSKDAATCEVLSEKTIIVKDPKACGMLIYG